MQRLIDDLLAYSRLDSQARPHGPVDLSLVLDASLRDLAGPIAETGAVVTREPLPEVRGDAVQLGQVLVNLIGNALKLSGSAPPRVEVSAAREGNLWQVTVRDHGIGIPAAEHSRIFTLFQRLHSREQVPGSGIGLALCQRVVERHGGRVWVESEPGSGARFHFTLPAVGGEV